MEAVVDNSTNDNNDTADNTPDYADVVAPKLIPNYEVNLKYHLDRNILIEDCCECDIYFYAPKNSLDDVLVRCVPFRDKMDDDISFTLDKETLERYVYELINMRCNDCEEDEGIRVDMYLSIREQYILSHLLEVNARCEKKKKLKAVKQFFTFYNIMRAAIVV